MSQVAAQHQCKTVGNVIAHLQRLLPPEYELRWNRPSPADELAHPNKFQTFKVICISNKTQLEAHVYPNDFINPNAFEVALNRPGVSRKKVRPKTCTTDLMNLAIVIKKLVPCTGSDKAAVVVRPEK